MDINGISIVICTRNRIDDLKRCIESIVHQESLINYKLEVIVVDDGDIPQYMKEYFTKILSNFDFKYYKKKNPGLLNSRIESIELVSQDIILFLDDDVVLENDYISKLIKTYKNNPKVSGISGIDLLTKSSFFWKVYSRLFCLSSWSSGKLSLSGFGGSMTNWSTEKEIFKTEFLSGCNMSFKKNTLKNLKYVNWLNNYSLGEDIYLSFIAMSNTDGYFIINPELKLAHFQSPASRDKNVVVATTQMVNHYKLLRLKKAKWWKFIFIFWSYIGLYINAILKLNFDKIIGYNRGLLKVLLDSI